MFVELINGLTTTSYTATGLTRGSTYTFKVQARNLYGDSAFSTTKSVLAAQKPDIVINVATEVTGSTVTFIW